MSARRTISAGTELCGIVLHPAGHTRSPAMHNAAFAALDMDRAEKLAADLGAQSAGPIADLANYPA